mmetsp:Transcript_19785/g.56167  ORF Transcript_19785/g.56167 Transcript_19785/m.56167 type:complete len:202 (+) Transcript_19785:292-897(+)
MSTTAAAAWAARTAWTQARAVSTSTVATSTTTATPSAELRRACADATRTSRAVASSKVWAAAFIDLGEARSPLSSAFRTTWPSFPSATCVKRAPWRLDSYEVLGSRRRHALISESLPQPSPPSTTTRADPGAAVAGGGGCADGASSGALVESQPQGLRESPGASSPSVVGRTQAVSPSSQPRSAGGGAPPLSVTACWNMRR